LSCVPAFLCTIHGPDSSYLLPLQMIPPRLSCVAPQQLDRRDDFVLGTSRRRRARATRKHAGSREGRRTTSSRGSAYSVPFHLPLPMRPPSSASSLSHISPSLFASFHPYSPPPFVITILIHNISRNPQIRPPSTAAAKSSTRLRVYDTASEGGSHLAPSLYDSSTQLPRSPILFSSFSFTPLPAPRSLFIFL
jgi:hypothetical protein